MRWNDQQNGPSKRQLLSRYLAGAWASGPMNKAHSETGLSGQLRSVTPASDYALRRQPVFTIEYTIVRGRDQPTVVERMRLFRHGIFGAEHMAISAFERVKRSRRGAAPDSYRLLDNDGNVVLRWLEVFQPCNPKRIPTKETRVRGVS